MDAPKDSPYGLITILGTEWKVLVYPFMDAEHFGETFVDKAEIHINSSKAATTNRDTFLHEVIHALDLSLRLGMTETQVGSIATALIAFFHENPELSRWLTHKSEGKR